MEFDKKFFDFVDQAVQEDIGSGDHSTLTCIPKSAMGAAALKIKQAGVLAGVAVAEKIFSYKSAHSKFTVLINDGKEVNSGEIAFTVESDIHSILHLERIVLNCMQRMSGIATLTKQYSDKLKGFNTKLLDTRKTTPNFRLLEKEAVRIGGGENHRFGLYDMIMLKDNHIDFCGSIEKAILKAADYVQSKNLSIKIEVETRNLEEVKKVINVGKGKVFRVMLDNFTPTQLIEAIRMIGDDFETEASGGINLENIEEYAKTGVNFISVGALIHQAKSLDFSLKAVIK
ncbi:MAG: carboxylating nicotinate-nucleotide diphosphorylase [Chitinophagaceae bacterium]|nr:MAG: carboxylating nicotinate-nucleotide diphosphorylase [Chitinophagaceae bacterium]